MRPEMPWRGKRQKPNYGSPTHSKYQLRISISTNAGPSLVQEENKQRDWQAISGLSGGQTCAVMSHSLTATAYQAPIYDESLATGSAWHHHSRSASHGLYGQSSKEGHRFAFKSKGKKKHTTPQTTPTAPHPPHPQQPTTPTMTIGIPPCHKASISQIFLNNPNFPKILVTQTKHAASAVTNWIFMNKWNYRCQIFIIYLYRCE